MTTTIYFIRHGQTIWNQEHRMQGFQNSPLTELGQFQARQLSHRLATFPTIDRIVASPSPRAQQTAHLVNLDLGLPITTDAAFQELNMGNWEGRTYTEIEAASPQEWANFWQAPEQFQASNGGETFADLATRALAGFNALVQQSPNQTIAVVSHRITIRVLLSQLLNVDINQIDDPKPTSLTELIVIDNQYHLSLMNSVTHYEA
ncbi:histidine phosphatase family protein [Secundilactobacillus similis]|uniref:Phosphoglycerate mutase n=1 Tax=Secundilactobacillus similis DSM 23365 = JCM 2765 TaxID=1423804 RepID=A0A0R2EHX3_9LACO|nr:histidine phosphatase family protein [Secundilactobacillus similis]KRN15983.1 hypothetical protein FD14_GL002791 [Secundilactobacillus similis DSM 23365 = JCM 2765]